MKKIGLFLAVIMICLSAALRRVSLRWIAVADHREVVALAVEAEAHLVALVAEARLAVVVAEVRLRPLLLRKGVPVF